MNNTALLYGGAHEQLPSEHNDILAAFVDTMMMAAFNRDNSGDATYGWRDSGPFTTEASAILRDNSPKEAE